LLDRDYQKYIAIYPPLLSKINEKKCKKNDLPAVSPESPQTLPKLKREEKDGY
jgi:hypothetical protein